MAYYGFQCYVDDKFLGWLYTYNQNTEIGWTAQSIEWCLKWKTEKGATKNFDYYNSRWQHQSGGGYLKIALLPDISENPQKALKEDNLINQELDKIDVIDTDYADIIANSADVNFELQLVKFGMDLAEARTKTNFINLMKHKPKTEEEWEKLAQAWEEACGYKPTRHHLLLVEKLLWAKSEEAIEQ